ncbi:MAG: S1/P1 nuclease [Opitutaceae bacterium]|jgi:hypothetical protein|nr:S1/P1 nuclease [Opitutaceae bacterium]
MHIKNHTRILLAALLLAASNSSLSAWGFIGHYSVAAIAEANLTPKAKANIRSFIEGRSIVWYALWMDGIRGDPAYEFTYTWHSAWVDKDFRHVIAEEKVGGKGDIITALDGAIADLRDYKKLPPEKVAFNIKLLVHLIGDSHCPGHAKYLSINPFKFDVYWGKKKLTYHQVWDTQLVEYKKWGYLEYLHQLNRLSPPEIAKITAGSPVEWFEQMARECAVIYDWAKPGDTLSGEKYHRDFIEKATVVVESQIQKAGYRLARLLNDAFDK